jgi:hypothetical protein
MSESEELPAVITVDWEAIEDDLGHGVETDLRRVIEHTGSTDPYMLDKWGYAAEATTALFNALKDHGRVIHPDRGPLDARYAPLRTMRATISVFRALRGEERVVTTIIEDGDDEEYLEGLADLYDAAHTLDERRDDWREGQHPTIRHGSHGPDTLGSHYIRVGHDDRSILDAITVEDLPIEREHVVARRDHWDSTEDYFAATFRHERYYPENRHAPVEETDR